MNSSGRPKTELMDGVVREDPCGTDDEIVRSWGEKYEWVTPPVWIKGEIEDLSSISLNLVHNDET